MSSLLVGTGESPTIQKNTIYYSDSTSLDGEELIKDDLVSLAYTSTSGVKFCSSEQGLILLETSSRPDSLQLQPFVQRYTNGKTELAIWDQVCGIGKTETQNSSRHFQFSDNHRVRDESVTFGTSTERSSESTFGTTLPSTPLPTMLSHRVP